MNTDEYEDEHEDHRRMIRMRMKTTLQNCCPLTELPMLSKGGEYKAMHITLGTTFESYSYWRCLKLSIIIIIIIVLLMDARQYTILYQENRSRDP